MLLPVTEKISVSCTPLKFNNFNVTPFNPMSALFLSSVCLRKVKNKRKFQTFSSKSGRGHLREGVGYKRFKI